MLMQSSFQVYNGSTQELVAKIACFYGNLKYKVKILVIIGSMYIVKLNNVGMRAELFEEDNLSVCPLCICFVTKCVEDFLDCNSPARSIEKKLYTILLTFLVIARWRNTHRLLAAFQTIPYAPFPRRFSNRYFFEILSSIICSIDMRTIPVIQTPTYICSFCLIKRN